MSTIAMRLINKLERIPLFQKVVFLVPFSPFRGIVWSLLDKNSRTILEAGCGRGGLGRLINLHGKSFFKVGVDIYRPYVVQCHREGIYESCAVADVTHLPFRRKTFDTVLCIEVIEHLPKEKGLALLSELEEIARRQVIIATTCAPELLKLVTNAGIENPSMVHESLWTSDEFRRLGYKVRGVYPRFPSRFFARIVRHPAFDPVYYLSLILPLICFVYFIPNRAKAIICIKNLEQ